MPMKHPNNPYDRADSYRVAVAIRNKAAASGEEGRDGRTGEDQTIPTSNIFARLVYWALNLGNQFADPEDLELLKKDFEIDEHKMNLDEFFMKIGTDPRKGYTQAKAIDLLSRDGPNNILIAKDYSLLKDSPSPVIFAKRALRYTLTGHGITLWLTVALALLVYGLDIYYFYRFTSQYVFIALFLCALNITNGSLIYLQKRRLAASLKDSFSKILPKQCVVLRGGNKVDVFTEEVVVGDIVEVRAGDLVPADIRLIECNDTLKVDSFNLLGDRELQVKHYAFHSNDPLTSPNMLYASTKVKEGIGRGVVIGTGNKTVIGRIIALAEKMIKIEVPLSEELRDLMCYKLPVYVVLISLVGLTATMGFLNYTWLDGLAAVLAIVIAFLPSSFYITLTLGMYLKKYTHAAARSDNSSLLSICCFKSTNKGTPSIEFENNQKGRRKGLVGNAKGAAIYENLESIETLGDLTTLLVDDKALFIDEDINKLSYVWYDGNLWVTDPVSPQSIFFGDLNAANGISQHHGKVPVHSRNETWHMLSRVALCCNPHFTRKSQKEVITESPQDTAIVNYMESIQSNASKVRDIYRKIADIPTKNAKLMQMTIHLYENYAQTTQANYPGSSSSNPKAPQMTTTNWRHYAFIRGHPLYIIQRCTSICIAGHETVLTEELRRAYYAAYQRMMGESHFGDERSPADNDAKYVIAFAEARLSQNRFPRDFDFIQYFGQASANYTARQHYQSSKGSSLNYNMSTNINTHSTLNSYHNLHNLSSDGTVDDISRDAVVESDNESYLFEEMDFKLMGMIALRAPAKTNVRETRSIIHKFKNAGIKVIMLTSQPKEIAKRMAKNYGIFEENSETVEDLAEKLNLTVDKIDPSEVNCHIVDCEDLKDMSYAEIDNTISSLLYDHYSTGTLSHSSSKTMMSLNQTATFTNSNFQILFCSNKDCSSSVANLGTNNYGASQHANNYALTPSQAIHESHNKLRLIESFQRLGDVVAVTGRTTSDCIPLKRCDIGIALKDANDIALHAGDVCLQDDNLKNILELVEQGRIFYDNMKKVLSYIFASNMSQLVPVLVFLLINIPMPLGIITMLCIDLGTDLLPSIALFNEGAEGNVLRRRPRDIYSDKLADIKLFKKSGLFVGMIQVFAGFLVYFIIMAENGFRPQALLGNRLYWNADAINDIQDSYGQEWSYRQRKNLEYTSYAGFFISIVLIQIVHALLCRNKYRSVFNKSKRQKTNWLLHGCLVFEIVLALLLIYTPGLNYLLGFQPLKFWWILPALPFVLFLFLYDEFRKFLIRRDPECAIAQETLY